MSGCVRLRWYQSEAVEALDASPGKRALAVLPTGSGKTIVMAELARRAIERGERVVFLAHRAELVQQIERALLEHLPSGVDVGVVAQSMGRREHKATACVASIASVVSTPQLLGTRGVAVVDECHLISPNANSMFRRVLDVLNPRRTFGLTATPYRMFGGRIDQGPHAMFPRAVYEAGIAQLLRDGYLSPLKTASPSVGIDLSSVSVRSGDYSTEELAEAVERDGAVDKVVAECVSRIEGRKHVLVFAVSVAHAEHLATAFLDAGISAAVVAGNSKRDYRDDVLARFAAGQIRVVVNCEVLTTGFDLPALDCVVLARPTKSAGLYYQMCGRGFRVHPGKRDCLVLDFGENVERHGPVDLLANSLPTSKHYTGAGTRVVTNDREDRGEVELAAKPSEAPILSAGRIAWPNREPTYDDLDGDILPLLGVPEKEVIQALSRSCLFRADQIKPEHLPELLACAALYGDIAKLHGNTGLFALLNVLSAFLVRQIDRRDGDLHLAAKPRKHLRRRPKGSVREVSGGKWEARLAVADASKPTGRAERCKRFPTREEAAEWLANEHASRAA